MLWSDDDSRFQRYFLLSSNGVCGVLWSPTVLCLTLALYALSCTANGLVFSYITAAVLISGVLYFGNAHPPQQIFTQQNYSLPSHWDDDDVGQKEDQYEDSLQKLVLFYPPLTQIVDQLLQYFYNDFVHYWWNPLQSEHDDEFEKLIKARLNTAVTNVEKTLLKQERNDIIMSIMYGLANILIIHMRECRTFESSEIPMESYVIENPQSPFAQLMSKKEQHQQLRGLSNTILKRILPKEDMDSALISRIFQELLSAHLLENILATCSDPDFLNDWIVQYLSDDLDDLDDTHLQSTLAESDGLRSLVEKATEDAMAAEKLQQMNCQFKLDDTLDTNHDNLSVDETMNMTKDQDDTRRAQLSSISQHNTPATPAPLKNVQPTMNHDSPAYDTSVSTALHGNKQLRSPAKTEDGMFKSPMIYTYGTVSFSIMNITPPQDMATLDKFNMAYIIQIERPALKQTTGSEGGGYVITRTYNDFDTFQALMRAKHGKRVTRLNLRLPLDVTRSWLGKKRPAIGSSAGVASASGGTGLDGEAISQGLEHYLNIVVGDAILGRDPLINAFLQKEKATENGTAQQKFNFAEEYSDALATYTPVPLVVDTITTPTSMGTRAMSLFGRSSGSTPTSWSPSLWTSNSGMSHNDLANGMRKPTRQGSISSTKSSNDSTSSGKDLEEEQEIDTKSESNYETLSATPSRIKGDYDAGRQKPLSAMDTELLIETTFALIVEIFDLTTANNKAWMRRSLLNILREIVRRSYTELVAKKYNDYIQAYLSPTALVGWMQLIKDIFWPDGIYNMNSTERTLEEKKQTKQLARQLLLQRAVPGGVRQLIGDQNCTLAMERIFTRLQNEELNRVLILQVLERVAKPLFG